MPIAQTKRCSVFGGQFVENENRHEDMFNNTEQQEVGGTFNNLCQANNTYPITI